MRSYIYKTQIEIIALIIVFEFTIGRTLNKITKQTEIILTKEGRKEIINTLKNEMQKAIDRENYLKEDERILINNFLDKIKKELNWEPKVKIDDLVKMMVEHDLNEAEKESVLYSKGLIKPTWEHPSK